MFGRERIEYKSADQVRAMRRAGLVVADALDAARAAAVPGATTADVDAAAARVIVQAGATPSFLGYHGYPATVCVSVNDEVVHGIPGGRVLAEGDVVSIDCGAVVGGWHGDSALSFVLGDGTVEDRDLVATGEEAMWAGIAALAGADRLGAVGDAIEDVVDDAHTAGRNGGVRLGVVEDYVGHGIGSAMHQPPDVLNYRTRDRGAKVRPGLCVAVEPMLVRGEQATRVLADDWTVVTEDGSRAAHWEHTVAILDGGIWVLTARDGGLAGLAPHGVTPTPLD